MKHNHEIYNILKLSRKNYKLADENLKLKSAKFEPSIMYEKARKRIIKSVNPFWENFQSECSKFKHLKWLKTYPLKKIVREYKL